MADPLKRDGSAPLKRALFVLPTDCLAGAERVTVTLAATAAREQLFQQVDIYVLSRAPSGSLTHLDQYGNIKITYSGRMSEKAGILPFARFVMGRKYELCFSSLSHINAMCCKFRRLGLLRVERLVTRENNRIFDDAFEAGTKRFARTIIRSLIRLYGNQDLIICQTDHMAERLSEHTKGRLRGITRVLPNFVDLERIGKLRAEETDLLDHIPESITRIVWCARFARQKRPDRAIETMKILRERGYEDVHLIMIGDGILLADIEAMIKKQGLGGEVTLCGFQANPIKIMARCDYGLLSSDLEGFPNVVMEMLGAGVRGVVATDCADGLRDVPGVHVTKEKTPIALALGLCQIMGPARPAGIDEYLATRDVGSYLREVVGQEPVC